MKKLLIKNIGLLQGCSLHGDKPLRGAALATVESIANAYLATDGERIASFGEMAACPAECDFHQVIDAQGGIVHPAFCDSHTHIVYAGSREGEFLDKINGLSYEEIARRGGGILNSADRLHDTSEDDLTAAALRRLRIAAALGTGAIEIKSGYGLTLDDELKMLRVIARLRHAMPQMEIRATFLGAHAVGRAFTGRQSQYVDHIIADMLPAVADQGIAQFVDVFCDKGFFTVDETDRILRAAAPLGLLPKIHANELDCSGGVQIGIKHGALSVDHLERIGQAEIDALAASDTVATMLPGASFFLGMPYGPARAAAAGGCIVALASDWNPGSSPSGSMPMVRALGSIKMKLTPDQTLNATTINGAAAMGLTSSMGTITEGKFASVVIYRPEVTNPAYIPYAYTEPLIRQVLLKAQPQL